MSAINTLDNQTERDYHLYGFLLQVSSNSPFQSHFTLRTFLHVNTENSADNISLTLAPVVQVHLPTDTMWGFFFFFKSWNRKLSGTLISHLQPGDVINSRLPGCPLLANAYVMVKKARLMLSLLLMM